MKFAFALAFVTASSFAFGQMVSGKDMPGFNTELGLTPPLQGIEVSQAGTSLVANVLWPGEQGSFTFRLVNRTDKPRLLKGSLRVVGYRTSVPPGDIWTPHVARTGIDGPPLAISADLKANSEALVTLKPTVPSRFGGYALVLDFGKDGRAFGATVTRVVKAEEGSVFEPTYAIDMPWPHEMSEAVTRTFLKLGVKGCRMGASYTPTTHPEFERDLEELGRWLEWSKKNNITVMLTIGAGKAPMPLGRGRPWLRPDNSMIEGAKEDLAWLPQYDDDFRKWVRIVCERFGWPKGPVNAVELWNEPWEGVSISGWGADLPRYREIYRQMGLGVMDARESVKAKVLIGGTSSSTNTRDKLFPDGSLEFLDMLDFVSIHYEGTGASPALEPMWMNRKGPYGRVRVWDTESWVANSEDRVAGVVASMRSFGQDRAMGTYGGNVYSPQTQKVGDEWVHSVQAWSPSAAVAAAAKFIGQRPFQGLLFSNGLPWVYVFPGETKKDDGTLVVLGDLTTIYSPRAILFRQAQMALPAKGGMMTLKAQPGFVMLDFAGNPVAPVKGLFTVPLNGKGFFLRTNGSAGSFARLQAAVKAAKIVGYPPAVIQAKDFLDQTAPVLRVTLTNVLNRPVKGALSAQVADANLAPVAVSLKAGEVKELSLPVSSFVRNTTNLYPAAISFNAGADGTARHQEDLRVNVIQRLSPVVDGDLGEWKDALPQSLTGEGMKASLTEEAWLPFVQRIQSGSTLTTAHAAYDEKGFYFAARISDPTPFVGGVRYETRDDDRYYYPEVVTTTKAASGGFAVRWTGKITAPTAGDYRILTETDDGVRLWLDGKLVIDRWVDQGATIYDHQISLDPSKPVDLRMEYFQGGGGAVARLMWEGPGLARTAIPGEFKREVFADRDMQMSAGTKVDSKIDHTLDLDFPGLELGAMTSQMRWPAGIRRFSYRMDPDIPSGNGTDNVQLAFNVLPNDQKRWKMNPPGVMPKYMIYPCTDYEYALNLVSPEFGGGTEIWRLMAPGTPRKHFYPRQPKAPIDGGPVKEGQLAIRRDKGVRLVESFIPWSEIPHVKAALDKNQTVKFSFRVNDNDGPAYELAQGRSVSKENPAAFHNDWSTHWANEIEFAFERGK
jgi:hypothetical protein